VFCSYACGNTFHNRINNAKQKLPGEAVHCAQCGQAFVRAENSKKMCCSLKCTHKYTRHEEVLWIRQMRQVAPKLAAIFTRFLEATGVISLDDSPKNNPIANRTLSSSTDMYFYQRVIETIEWL